MPDVQDYLSLASEADDFATWTPDPKLAASYRRLAGAYHAVPKSQAVIVNRAMTVRQ